MPNLPRPPSSRPASDEPPQGRDAAIEALLLAGLDHYFAGDHERAIHAWERVLFLDRGHRRARAYIDRARVVVAERQREVDARLHDGIEAFRLGDAERARELLTSVVEDRPDDQALAWLQRMQRISPAGGSSLPDIEDGLVAGQTTPVTQQRPPGRAQQLLIGAAGLLLIVAAVVVLRWEWVERWWFADAVREETTVASPGAGLPEVRGAELALARARALYARGHLHEALRALDDVAAVDPLHGTANGLRAEIQRTLLAAIEPAASRPGPAASRP